MVGNLISFPTMGAVIPLPLYARSGDLFRYVVFDDFSHEHMGVFAGCIIVFYVGHISDKMLHLINTDDGPVLAWLTKENLFEVRIQSAQPSLLPSGIYKLTDLDIVGSEIERWPSGLTGTRMSLWNNERAATQDDSRYERSLKTVNS